MADDRTPFAPPARVLITGVAGFIGSTLADELLARGYAVVGADNFLANYGRTVKEANLAAARAHPAFTFYELDLAREDLEPLVADVAAVVHLAARPGVRDSWGAHYEEYLTHNILATQRLLEALRGRPDALFVLGSSSSIYGDVARLPVAEDATPAPVSPYGATKLAAEDLVHLYVQSYGLRATVLRFFTVYGPRQRPDMAIHKFIRALRADEPLVLYGGDERRDFTYVGDVARAAAEILARGVTGGVFNVASGATVAVADLVRMLEEVVGKKARVKSTTHQRGDVHATHGDISALRAAIGWAPATPLAEGLAAQAAWMAETPAAAGPTPRPRGRRRAVCAPRLSVIVVNYNTGHFVGRCIDSCWEAAPAEGEMELIVVDNASADGGAEALAAREDIIFIQNRQNVGYAAANNQGIARSRGEFLMLVNPDVEVGPGLFARLMEFMNENPDAGVVGPALVSPNGRIQESYRRFPHLVHLLGNRRSLIYRWWPQNPFSRRGFYGDVDLSAPAKVDFIAGAAMMFKRRLVDLIGPMDAKYFMYVEDADFCRRARLAGYYTYLLPQLSALHYWGESSSLHPYRMVFIHHISMMRYFRRHQPLQFAVYIMLLPAVAVHIVFELLHARRASRRRRERVAAEAAEKAGLEPQILPPQI